MVRTMPSGRNQGRCNHMCTKDMQNGRFRPGRNGFHSHSLLTRSQDETGRNTAGNGCAQQILCGVHGIVWHQTVNHRQSREFRGPLT